MLTGPAIVKTLSRRGYVLVKFENVLGLRLEDHRDVGTAVPIDVREAGANDGAAWLDTGVTDFMTPDMQGVEASESYPREALESLVQLLLDAPGYRCCFARIDGGIVGAATTRVDGGLAQLCGASTLPAPRACAGTGGQPARVTSLRAVRPCHNAPVSDEGPDPVAAWLDALETRHLADLTFPEVSRALRALSSCYVERRSRLGRGAALDGAGKRAAFALFYGPLHFLLVRHIVAELGATLGRDVTIIDLGCGTGVAGAAWAIESGGAPALAGIDRHPWAVREAEWTWRALGLRGHASVGDATKARLPRGRLAMLAAFAVNEWPAPARDAMRDRLLEAVAAGRALLVIEPLAGGVAPWWREWVAAFAPAGGRADEWRLHTALPDIVSRLDHAVGLDHREITGRSIYVALRTGG